MMSKLGEACNMQFNEERQCWEGNEELLEILGDDDQRISKQKSEGDVDSNAIG